MNTSRLLLAFVLCAMALPAAAGKPCEELKGEIDAKIRANGVPTYTFNIIDAADETQAEGKIVGRCDGGTKRIVYVRGSAPDATPTDAGSTPPAG